jgi:uncharacterized repeat protein (TIGR01451 family)
MKAQTLSILLLVAALLIAPGASSMPAAVRAAPLSAIGVPQLKWQHGGCYTSWCETGWYSSPAVADLDKDGTMEVIGGGYTLFALDGATGSQKWHADPPVSNARIWPGVVVADIDGDGDLEIVTAHGYGYVRALRHDGSLYWSDQPTPGYELRSLAVYDLDGDGDLEILVASTRAYDQWFVYEHDGTPYAGSWPRLADSGPGYASGCFNENIAVADLDKDGRGEIIGPSDVHYITAYEDDGTQTFANSRYNVFNPVGPKFWSQVGVHVDDAVDLIGYANCANPPQPPLQPRPNFADSAPAIADVNGDGTLEVIVVGNNYDCRTRPYTDLYHMPFIFNRDRSRWSGSGFDWTAIPTPDAAARPLSEDYNLIESALPNPVVVDIDGDGYKEILYASYDGRVHAYWLDKTQHGSWPYHVYPGSGSYRFASEPAVADLDGDGHGEIVFASWTQKGSYQTGKLHILDYLGNVLQEVNLPAAFGSSPPNWNGALAAPTLADVDGDSYLEAVLNTAHSGLVAYDLPGTVANARVLWGTGRGNYWRNGAAAPSASLRKQVSRPTADFGNTLAYTLTLVGSGAPITLTDAIPAGAAYVAGSASADPAFGSLVDNSTGLTWTGTLTAAAALQVTFAATVTATDPQAIANRARLDDGQGITERTATTIANGLEVYLPLVRKQ